MSVAKQRFIDRLDEAGSVPKTTTKLFPKNLIIETNKLINNGNLNIDIYNEYCSKYIEHTTKYLTTKSVFLNLLNNCTL